MTTKSSAGKGILMMRMTRRLVLRPNFTATKKTIATKPTILLFNQQFNLLKHLLRLLEDYRWRRFFLFACFLLTLWECGSFWSTRRTAPRSIKHKPSFTGHSQIGLRQWNIPDYSRLSDNFVENSFGVCKNHERIVADVRSICINMFEEEKS